MHTIVAGSRTIQDRALVAEALESAPWSITAIYSGGARGVDALGEEWAAAHGIPVRRFPANWAYYGRGAGPKRNVEMAKAADALIAIWDGRSPGTAHMISEARRKGLLLYVVRTDE